MSRSILQRTSRSPEPGNRFYESISPLFSRLMDGGIVDNQGIEPVLLANERMERNIKDAGGELSGAALDLIIVCDVTSPYMEDNKARQQKQVNWCCGLTPAMIITINTLVLFVTCFLIFYSIRNDYLVISAIASAIAAFCLSHFIFGRWLGGLPKKFKLSKAFLKPLKK